MLRSELRSSLALPGAHLACRYSGVRSWINGNPLQAPAFREDSRSRMFTPAGNPHVTRRFEAEAADPLHAVNAVLGQIDDWLKQQYAAPVANSFRTTSL